jgi:hypothetical protein
MMQSLCPEVVDNEVVMSGAANFSLRRKAPQKRPEIEKEYAAKTPIPLTIHGLIQNGAPVAPF